MDYDVNNELWRYTVYVSDDAVHYFNSDGIYTSVSRDAAKKIAQLQDLESWHWASGYGWMPRSLNSESVLRAILALRIGDSFEDLKKVIEKLNEESRKRWRNYPMYNVVYRVKNNKLFYFFNEEGVCSCLEKNDMLKSGVKVTINEIWGNYIFSRYSVIDLKKSLGSNYSTAIFKKALSKLETGDKLEKIDEYCQEVVKEAEEKQASLERFVTRIFKPDFVCVPENPNKKTTFDYIHVDVNLVMHWDNDKEKFIRTNAKKIAEMVLKSIENEKTFKKYGVPIEFLKIANVTLRRDLNSLHYVFELKK